MAAPYCPDNEVDKQQPSHNDETVAAEVANTEPSATEKPLLPHVQANAPAEFQWLSELPSGDEVLYVLAMDGHIDPDDEEASLMAYAQKVIEQTGERRRVVALPPWTPKMRLSKEEVDMILSFEQVCLEPYDEETQHRLLPDEPVEETMEIMRAAAEVSLEYRQDLIEYQDWIRGQLQEKGYVELPDKFLQERDEFIDCLQGELDDDMFKIPDRCFASSSLVVVDDSREEAGVAP